MKELKRGMKLIITYIFIYTYIYRDLLIQIKIQFNKD